MPPPVFLYHKRTTLSSDRNAWTQLRKIVVFCTVLSSTTSPTKSQCWSPVRRWLAYGWAWQARGQLALLRPSALPTLVPWSSSRLLWVSRRSSGLAVRSIRCRSQSCLSCGRHIRWRGRGQNRRLSAMWLWCCKATDSKIYGERWNLLAVPSWAQSGDVTGCSRGPTTFMVMCSSIVMVAYLWEYAQVTKNDLSPQLATLFPVSYWNFSCKCAVNEELEYGLPFEFWIEIGENEKSELVTQFFTPHYCDLQLLRVPFGQKIPNEVSSAISPGWTILLSYSC